MIKPDGKRNIREIITDQVMEEAPIEATEPTVSKKNIAQIIPKKCLFVSESLFRFSLFHRAPPFQYFMVGLVSLIFYNLFYG